MSANIQIGQLPQTNSIVNTMQFPVEVANVTQKIYATSIKNYVTSLAFLNSAGNVTAGNLVTAGNVHATNIFVTNPITANLSLPAQANITRIGNLLTANVSGNVSTGNVSATKFTGSELNVTSIRGTVLTASQPNITTIGSLTELVAGTAGNLVAASSAPSISTTTGALVVVGGLGVGGDVNIGGLVQIESDLAVQGLIEAATANPAAANLQVATTEFVKTYGLGKADLNSPVFTGTPVLPLGTTAVTQSPGDNTTKLATTEFVQTAIFGSSPDLAPFATKNSPVFTGSPSLPTGTVAVTQLPGDNSSKLATTAFVNEANVGLANNISNQLSLKAPLANPVFSGTVTGVTKAMVGLSDVDNTSDLDKTVSTATQTALNLKANLAGPTFTGTVTLPSTTVAVTPSPGDNTTKPATTAFVTSAIQLAVPSGTILVWPWVTAPDGYLLCQGQAVSRTAYSALFTLFTTTFGSGDGSTTFNLPDLRNRMPLGQSAGKNLGDTGGSENAVVVSHTHIFTGVPLPNHSHTYEKPTSTAPQSGSSTNCLVPSGATLNTSSVSAGTPSGTNSTEGESGVGKNLPPYLVVNYIIKT